MGKAPIRLFAYGTLRQAEVQLATYGRHLDGTPDTLSGFRLEPLAISDRHVVAISGKAVHLIARRSGEATDRIAGMVFDLTPAELEQTDRYEVDAYDRVEVTLDSGIKACVYAGPDVTTA